MTTPARGREKADAFLRRMSQFLRTQGWLCIMAGPLRIRSRSDGRKYCYTLEVDFLGRILAEDEKRGAKKKPTRRPR